MATRQFSTDQFAGGKKDEVLGKKSNADFDMGWGEVKGGGGGGGGAVIANVILSNLIPSEGVTQFGVDLKVEAISPYKSFCHDVLWIGDDQFGGCEIGYEDDEWYATAVCYDQDNGLWDLKPADNVRDSGIITWTLQTPEIVTGFSNKSSAFTADSFTVIQIRLSLKHAVLRWDGESESATLVLDNDDLCTWEVFEESGDQRTLVFSTSIIDNRGDSAQFTVDVSLTEG